MHPGPMNRGIEISSDIADGPHSGILKQVTNGLAVRMAVLYPGDAGGGVRLMKIAEAQDAWKDDATT